MEADTRPPLKTKTAGIAIAGIGTAIGLAVGGQISVVAALGAIVVCGLGFAVADRISRISGGKQ